MKPLLGSVEAKGIWGGTTELERKAVDHLPPEEAIELLDRVTSQRIERRIERYIADRPHHGARRILGRIDAMVEERGGAKRARDEGAGRAR